MFSPFMALCDTGVRVRSGTSSTASVSLSPSSSISATSTSLLAKSPFLDLSWTLAHGPSICESRITSLKHNLCHSPLNSRSLCIHISFWTGAFSEVIIHPPLLQESSKWSANVSMQFPVRCIDRTQGCLSAFRIAGAFLTSRKQTKPSDIYAVES